MQTFIRAAEIWLPVQDQALLEFGAGLFGEAHGFAAASRAMRFARAQGLPGKAWDQGRPLLLNALEGAHFHRADEARQAGLTCAVALPFFVAGRLTSVLVLFGSDDQACTGAIELWRNDPRISSDMTLVDGYYGGTEPAFEQLSRDTYLPRGMGLPGMAWQREEAVIMGELGASTRFLRGDVASDSGICRGLAMPCDTTGHASYVLTLLSGDDTPIARRTERWLLDTTLECLKLAGGYCETQGPLDHVDKVMRLALLDPLVTEALRAGTPVLSEAAAQMAGPIGDAASSCGATGCVWVPVMSEDKVSELVALYL